MFASFYLNKCPVVACKVIRLMLLSLTNYSANNLFQLNVSEMLIQDVVLV